MRSCNLGLINLNLIVIFWLQFYDVKVYLVYILDIAFDEFYLLGDLVFVLLCLFIFPYSPMHIYRSIGSILYLYYDCLTYLSFYDYKISLSMTYLTTGFWNTGSLIHMDTVDGKGYTMVSQVWYYRGWDDIITKIRSMIIITYESIRVVI